MKKLLLFIITFFLFNVSPFCQEKRLEIKESRKVINSTDINPLLDYQGNISGSYTGYFHTEKPLEMKVNYENTTLKIPKPLGMFIIAPKADRLFNYGNTPGFVVDYELKLNIFKLSGSLVTRIEGLGHAPYSVAVSSDGNFYSASFINKNEKESNLYFRKLDKNGNLKWETMLEGFNPVNIFISPDGGVAALVLQSTQERTFEVRFFTDKGEVIASEKNLGSVLGLEFISSGKFILIDRSNWSVCELKNEIRTLLKGKLPGLTFSTYPITVNSQSGWFSIVSNTGNNFYHVELRNISDGKIIASGEFEDTPYQENFRQFSVGTDNDLVLRTENQVIIINAVK
jgi:hypothetical protein